MIKEDIWYNQVDYCIAMTYWETVVFLYPHDEFFYDSTYTSHDYLLEVQGEILEVIEYTK